MSEVIKCKRQERAGEGCGVGGQQSLVLFRSRE